jgi:branched-chain amino acid transport system ATP-binding protein
VIVMAEGKVVAEGPPETIMQNKAVVDAYLGAHHDTDLGTLTNQQVAQIHEAAEEEVPIDPDAPDDGASTGGATVAPRDASEARATDADGQEAQR